MKFKILLYIITAVILTNCKPPNNTQFTEKALNSYLINLNDDSLMLRDILTKHRGKTVLIDVWAGWCGDCIKGLPKLKKIQEKFTEVNYLFISLDKNKSAWKKNINRYSIKGEHYYAKGGWKSIFASNINLDWIPRYIVINPKGKVVLYRAIHASDSDLIKSLETLQ